LARSGSCVSTATTRRSGASKSVVSQKVGPSLPINEYSASKPAISSITGESGASKSR
jgi:hypothetical protein